MTKENSLYCFDSKSLSTAQIKKISQNAKLSEIKARRSCALIVIDASDAPMYKYIFEARNLAKEFPQTRISGILDADGKIDVDEENWLTTLGKDWGFKELEIKKLINKLRLWKKT